MPEVSISAALDDFISLRGALLLKNSDESKSATKAAIRGNAKKFPIQFFAINYAEKGKLSHKKG